MHFIRLPHCFDFHNHYGNNHSIFNDDPDLRTDAVRMAQRDVNIIVSRANNTGLPPSWGWFEPVVGGNVDPVPDAIKEAGNADFAQVPGGVFGRVLLPLTAAATFEVYCAQALLAEFNGARNFGPPIRRIINMIMSMGGNVAGATGSLNTNINAGISGGSSVSGPGGSQLGSGDSGWPGGNPGFFPGGLASWPSCDGWSGAAGTWQDGAAGWLIPDDWYSSLGDPSLIEGSAVPQNWDLCFLLVTAQKGLLNDPLYQGYGHSGIWTHSQMRAWTRIVGRVIHALHGSGGPLGGIMRVSNYFGGSVGGSCHGNWGGGISAIDIAVGPANQTRDDINVEAGHRLAEWLKANHQVFGISFIVYDNRAWQPDHGFKPSFDQWRFNTDFGHLNHIHISLCPCGPVPANCGSGPWWDQNLTINEPAFQVEG